MIKTRAFQTSARAVFQPKGCHTCKSEMANFPQVGRYHLERPLPSNYSLPRSNLLFAKLKSQGKLLVDSRSIVLEGIY